jgi:hypothetical protein
MRRLAHHLSTLCSAVSLLLCVAVCVLWVRSYWVADVVVHWSPAGIPISNTLWSTSGYLGLVRWEPPGHSSVRVQKRGLSYEHGPAGANDPSRFLGSRDSRRLLGVAYFDLTYTRANSPFAGVRERALLIPYWLLLAAFGPLPLVRLLSLSRRRRAACAAGLCPNCGYDLRASPDRCPECGTSPEAT